MKKQMATEAATSRLTPMEFQHLQRLRINRVALIQELRVEHVLRSLAERGVLTDGDCGFIAQGRSQHERTQRLLDLLPTKGRKADWYRHFREALRSPDTASNDTRRQYRMLTEFLDSALVGRLYRDVPLPAGNAAAATAAPSSSAASATADALLSDLGPRLAALPPIGRHQSDGRPPADDASDKQHGHAAVELPSTATSGAVLQAAAAAATAASAPPSRESVPAVKAAARDREHHVAAEQAVFRTMREAEVAHAHLWASGRLPAADADDGGEGGAGSDLIAQLWSDGVIRMLLDAEHRHVYLKYLVALRTIKSVDILKDVAALYPALCDRVVAGRDRIDDKLEFVSKTSLGLVALLQDLGNFDDAGAVLVTAVGQLHRAGSGDGRPGSGSDNLSQNGSGNGSRVTGAPILTWRLLYEAQVSAIGLLLYRGDFAGASVAGSRAAELRNKLELVSFGKRAVDGTGMALRMHVLLRDTGHVAAANEWLRKAVQELDQADHEAVVRVLCAASKAYVFRGSLSRAETLVTHAVRLARTTFGMLHPLYVRALLHYVLFSNDMGQGDSGFATARRLVALGERVYGPNTVQAAVLHRAAAAAALAADRADDGAAAACRHARRALLTLLAALRGQAAPAVAAFREVLGLSLLRRAATVQDDAERAACIEEAGVELGAALDENEQWYGRASYRAAMSCYALGQLMVQLKDYTSGARYYERAAETLGKCSLPVGNSAVHMVKAALGCIYAAAGRFQEAIELLQHVTGTYHTQGYPLKWYAAAYQSLAACRRALGDADGARETEARLVAWSWDAEDHAASRRQALEGEPAQDLTSLFSEVNLWKGQYSKVLAGLRSHSINDSLDSSSPRADKMADKPSVS